MVPLGRVRSPSTSVRGRHSKWFLDLLTTLSKNTQRSEQNANTLAATTTLAHYLQLLAGAGMVCGLPKHAGDAARSRGSSPKLQVLNTALMTVTCGLTLDQARANREFWGHLVESAVGAHLANAAAGGLCSVSYWREPDREVDFVVIAGSSMAAIEVKSGRAPLANSALAAFNASFKPQRTLLVGGGGVTLADFMTQPVLHWVAP